MIGLKRKSALGIGGHRNVLYSQNWRVSVYTKQREHFRLHYAKDGLTPTFVSAEGCFQVLDLSHSGMRILIEDQLRDEAFAVLASIRGMLHFPQKTVAYPVLGHIVRFQKGEMSVRFFETSQLPLSRIILGDGKLPLWAPAF